MDILVLDPPDDQYVAFECGLCSSQLQIVTERYGYVDFVCSVCSVVTLGGQSFTVPLILERLPVSWDLPGFKL